MVSKWFTFLPLFSSPPPEPSSWWPRPSWSCPRWTFPWSTSSWTTTGRDPPPRRRHRRRSRTTRNLNNVNVTPFISYQRSRDSPSLADWRLAGYKESCSRHFTWWLLSLTLSIAWTRFWFWKFCLLNVAIDSEKSIFCHLYLTVSSTRAISYLSPAQCLCQPEDSPRPHSSSSWSWSSRPSRSWPAWCRSPWGHPRYRSFLPWRCSPFHQALPRGLTVCTSRTKIIC